MYIVFGVKNFGKITHAEIAMRDLVLFVGNNNSGKTMLMQLIYGTMEYLYKNQTVHTEGIEEIENSSYVFGDQWFSELEKKWNDVLKQNKEKIVEDIFKKNIHIEELYIKIENIEGKYIAEYKKIDNSRTNKEYQEDDEIIITREERCRYDLWYQIKKEKELTVSFVFSTQIQKGVINTLSGIVQNVILLGGRTAFLKQLLLPASRTGIQLLYKYFFSERDKHLINEIQFENDLYNDNIYGLTTPVYEYLQFLQNYTKDTKTENSNRDLLQFMEQHMLDGKITQESEDIYYQEFNTEERVPLYLASAMINEMTPIVKALTSANRFNTYYWDEIETCIHPLKQGELARFIVRAVNNGNRMIISTHSDTMACKLNNLIVLSAIENDDERNTKLNKLRLESDDILKNRRVSVYQFTNHENGKSNVKELVFQSVPQVGYDFNLFMQSLEELYKETEILME